MQNFTYTPLTDNDKIRILRLHEGHGSAELVGELITTGERRGSHGRIRRSAWGARQSTGRATESAGLMLIRRS